jgi:hypothetical protein
MNEVPIVSVLTANRLRDGRVVFLDFEGAWSERLSEAVVARFPDEVRALRDRGAYDAGRNIVIEPYLVEVHETAGGLLPVRDRERVRAAGPSVLGDVPGHREPAPVAWQAEQVGEDFSPDDELAARRRTALGPRHRSITLCSPPSNAASQA